MNNMERLSYILGLDLGVASIGWAMLKCNDRNTPEPTGVLRANVHRFESGTDGGKMGESGISKGLDEPRNKARRDARLMRRQTWRRARRKRKLLRTLFDPSVNLLPTPDELAARQVGATPTFGGRLNGPDEIHEYMVALDKDISRRLVLLSAAVGDSSIAHSDQQRLCYRLREAAARGPVQRHEFGRALYHLAQRRGFLSNRRAAKKADEKASDVLSSIDSLSRAIDAFGTRGGVPTLGAYLASLDPFAQSSPGDDGDPAKHRLRHRWTSRKMYEDEFNLMWRTQAEHMGLSEATRKKVHECIFFQRPLREPRQSVGTCFLMPDHARLKLAHPLYQEFRILQTVNDLRVSVFPAPERPLAANERTAIVRKLMLAEKVTFTQARKAAKLPDEARFSHERTTEKTESAHRGDQQMTQCFRLKLKGTPDKLEKLIRAKLGQMKLECDTETTRDLTTNELTKLGSAWCSDKGLTVDAARSVLGLNDTYRFIVVKETTNELLGNRTAARIRSILKSDYDSLSPRMIARLTRDLCAPLDDPSLEALLSRPRPQSEAGEDWLRKPIEERGWGFARPVVEKLVKIVLEEQRGSLSLRAIQRLLPHMRDGMSYATAVTTEFKETTGTGAIWKQLPPLACFQGHTDPGQCHQAKCGASANVAPVLRGIRNPAVLRTLSELRKLDNELVRQYGVPALIRIELSRDLKNPRLKRKAMTAENDRRRNRREIVKDRIRATLVEHGVSDPSDSDVEKWMLADECRWHCPYTQKPISRATIFTEFDVEHIWPLSLWLDDSLMNKTICHRDFNRKMKGNKIPSEALKGKDFDDAIAAVKRFNTDRRTRAEKLRRFQALAVDVDFTNRHLSDTRYIAKAAAAYLGLLYGGVSDPSPDGVASGTRRIYPGTGRVTKFLRTGLGISRVLADSPEKNRADHRHHAIDAIVIALSEPKWSVRVLQAAAKNAELQGLDRHFNEIEQPKTWKGVLRNDVKQLMNSMIVSHRESRKVSGAIHKDTTYSADASPGPDGKPVITLRKPIEALTVPEVVTPGRIRDKRIVALIHTRLREHGLDPSGPLDEKRMQSVLAEFPLMLPGHGQRLLRVRCVRVVQAANPIRIGNGRDSRLVKNENNHHTVVYSFTDTKGDEQWSHNVVTLKEAYDRLAAQRAAFNASLKAAIRDPKLLKRATHERPLLDPSLQAIVNDARRRAIAEHPIVQRELDQGQTFMFSLAKGDHLYMKDPDDESTKRVFRVRAISENEIKVIRTADNRKEAISGSERQRPNPEKLRQLGAEKVTITRLGEVRRCESRRSRS